MLYFSRMPRFKKDAFKIFSLIDEWACAYEARREDILRQLPIAHAWVMSNPKRAPKSQIGRFLNAWMRTAKKFGNLTARESRVSYKETLPDAADVMTAEDWAKMRQEMVRAKLRAAQGESA